MYWNAWHALRSDRHVGAMGGVGEIYYSALSRYAADHGIAGSAFDNFRSIVGAMDRVYVEWCAEKAEEAQKRAEQERGR